MGETHLPERYEDGIFEDIQYGEYWKIADLGDDIALIDAFDNSNVVRMSEQGHTYEEAIQTVEEEFAGPISEDVVERPTEIVYEGLRKLRRNSPAELSSISREWAQDLGYALQCIEVVER